MCSSDFNSIKVRLEQEPDRLSFQSLPIFQFHKGAIRTSLSTVKVTLTYNFNSIKVRLELFMILIF